MTPVILPSQRPFIFFIVISPEISVGHVVQVGLTSLPGFYVRPGQ